MIRNVVLPRDLNAMIGSERKDFAIKAGLAQPRNKSLAVIVFGLLIGFFVIIGISMIVWGLYSIEIEKICRTRIKENDPTPPNIQ